MNETKPVNLNTGLYLPFDLNGLNNYIPISNDVFYKATDIGGGMLSIQKISCIPMQIQGDPQGFSTHIILDSTYDLIKSTSNLSDINISIKRRAINENRLSTITDLSAWKKVDTGFIKLDTTINVQINTNTMLQIK